VLDRRSPVSVTGTADRRIAALAAHQRGRVARRQLLAAGLRPGAITRRIASGRLVAVHRGVYGAGHAAVGPWTRETEALLALREGAVLSHVSALALWDLCPALAEIHVSVVRSAARRLPGVRVHRVAALDVRDLRIRDGLPVTSPALALLHCAVELEPRGLERALDEGVRRGLVGDRELGALVDRGLGTRPARRRLTTLLEARTGTTFTRSEAEERFLALVREAGLPAPLVNVRRHGYELDFLWPEQQLAVEVDGYAFHGDRGAFERDRRKDAHLLAEGGIVVSRVTWRQLTCDAIATIVRIVRMLDARGE